MKIPERVVTTVLGRRQDGTPISRHQLINPRRRNVMADTHKLFSKSQKLIAKYNHKNKR
tara:strand:+ start:1488 stop:1664 length:177 start_codon:yes stop_codon:yes gene_type:complete